MYASKFYIPYAPAVTAHMNIGQIWIGEIVCELKQQLLQ